MKKLPPFLKRYFWEIDFEKLDPEKRQHYIAERILEHGDLKAARWLLGNFDPKLLEEVIAGSRSLPPKTGNFFANLLGIPKQKVRCLNKLSPEKRGTAWPY